VLVLFDHGAPRGLIQSCSYADVEIPFTSKEPTRFD
jgi:hypothetical protein